MKLCECGCGKPAPIATRNRYRIGHMKGQPIRFIQGHSVMNGERSWIWKGGKHISSLGYTMIYRADRPRNGGHRYRQEHVIIAERVIRKPLPEKAVIHHVNGARSDNANSNLVICEDQGYHLLLHERERAYRETGTVRAVKCVYCKKWEIIGNESAPMSTGNRKNHLSCHSFYEYRRKRAAMSSL